MRMPISANALKYSSRKGTEMNEYADKTNKQEPWTTGTIAHNSHASKVRLKILHVRLQQYVNQELPDVQVGLRKVRGTGNQVINIPWIIKNAREFCFICFIYLCFIDYTTGFDCVDHSKLQKIIKEMGIPDHLTCPLSNLYAGQEATVRTRHGTTDWFQIGKGVRQDCILSPWLFNLYAGYIMQNAGLEDAQAGIAGKIPITTDMQITPPLWQKVKN